MSLNITINKESTTVQNPELYMQWTLKTVEFFGNVYATLEDDLPDYNDEESAIIVIKHLIKHGLHIEGIDDKWADDLTETHLFGFNEFGTTLYYLRKFINGRDTLILTWKDIEKLRIEHNMEATYLPVSIIDDDGMRFNELNSPFQVVIAVLYYYVYNDYKLVKCSHCGKWFATKTLKEKYCKRISPCFGDIITGKTPLPCEQAVRNIKQKQRVRYEAIYKSFWNYNSLKADEQKYFMNKSYEMREAINQAPTVENFKRYEDFLNSYPKRTWKNKTKPKED